MTIPIAKFADLHDKIKSRDAEIARLKTEVAFLKSDNDRLRNNIAYLDKKLDDELDKGGQP
jgi:septal ring factor EnvC (AmiA/AmiB activator)